MPIDIFHFRALTPAVTAVVFLVLTGPVMAQADDPAARYERAEAFRLGTGVEQNAARAEALHSELAANGFARSQARLGAILEDRGMYDAARDNYVAAADAGNAYAALRLATGRARGLFGNAETARLGFSDLKAIAKNGDSTLARFYLAEAYANGYGTPIDPERAYALYLAMAEDGHALSQARVGARALARGDTATAAAFFDRAAEGGYSFGLIGSARARVAQGDGAGALAVIQRAMAENVSQAEARHAIWHYTGAFGAASDRALGAGELKRLAEAGDVYAARSALRQHERRSTRLAGLDLPMVLQHLETAADGGSRLAALALVRAYRELDWLIPDARAGHARTVADHGAVLGPRHEIPERLEALYDPEDHPGSRAAAYALLKPLSDDPFIYGMLRLRSIEPTAYVYAVQMELAELDDFDGRPSARLTAPTLDAIRAFCREQGIDDTCRHGPITYEASQEIVRALDAVRNQ